MKLRNLLIGTFATIALCVTFTSCTKNDDTPNDSNSKIELPSKRAYILYEGPSGYNKSGIAFYAPNKDADFQNDIFELQNNKKLGALANSFIEYKNHIYVVVSESKYISKLNEACVEVDTYKIPEGEGDPRNIIAYDGYLYVTQYGGKVTKIDANTMQPTEEYFSGGNNLEGITECNGNLYVANAYKIVSNGEDYNYIYLTEIFEINPKDMTLKSTLNLNVVENPERLMEIDDKVYLISRGNYDSVKNTLQVISPETKEVKNLVEASKMAKGINNQLLLINSNTTYDANWNATISNTFFTYNTKTGEIKNESFLKNAPEELYKSNIYLLAVDDETGEIYVGTSDYVNTGTIYRFSEDGTLKETFDAGGVNPNNMLFID